MAFTPVTVREGRGHASALSDQSLHLPGQWDKVQSVKNESRFLLPTGIGWVENDVLGIADEVRRVSKGRCRLASCGCGKCLERGHFPHVVLELTKRGSTAPVFGARELGPHIVQRLQQMHVSQNPNEQSIKHNEKLRTERRAKALEGMRERLEVVESALRSHKFDYRGPNGMRTKA